VIARMNVGGPAYHVSLLSGRLDRDRYSTLLVHGHTGPGEASFAELAIEEGCEVEVVEGLGPRINPVADARALVELVRIARRRRPRIVHTHTAKAGALGRIAALIATRPRPLIVHTYHGHVLESYFGPLVSRAYRLVERLLARSSDRLLAVSEATVNDLVRLRVAPRDAFQVVPLGLDLARFDDLAADAGAGFRRRLGVTPDELLVTFVGRLVAIKRVDVLLRAFARLRDRSPRLRLAIVGDGERRAELERLATALGIEDAVSFVGYLTDVTEVAAAADIAVLSSDNEGTPVSLIEAAAARVPAVATAVGGVPDVVTAETGILVPPGDATALAAGLARLADDAALRRQMGARARGHVRERFAVERLLADIDALYQELLG
jgi:glycosyltransferase involved in cell wall biosynthesis